MFADLELLASVTLSSPILYISSHAFPNIFACDDCGRTFGGWMGDGMCDLEDGFAEVGGDIWARSACADVTDYMMFSKFERLPF